MNAPARVCVVICYWTGRQPRDLHRLLRRMKTIDAGVPYDVCLVCNGGDVAPYALPAEFTADGIRVIQRRNDGWNLAAWEQGWRASPGYDHYLFLQDECRIRTANWIADFQFRMEHDAGIGLLGETSMWTDQSWPFIRLSTDRDLGARAWPADEAVHPLDTYQRLLRERGIDPGPVGTHLQSILLFTSRAILEEVGGFAYFGTTYREAVAAEIAISRAIAARGYRLSTVRSTPFAVFDHPQWTGAKPIVVRLKALARKMLRR